MAKAIFEWDDENIAHLAEHELTPEEVEPVVMNPQNRRTFSRSTGRTVVFGMTRTGRYIAVVFVTLQDSPWTVRVITAYDVPRPRRN
jgi:uncharacterized DUF497 family protein